MNIQELATIYCEQLPVKIMILNNQHLGMVVQWEDRFYKVRETKQSLSFLPAYIYFLEINTYPSGHIVRAIKDE